MCCLETWCIYITLNKQLKAKDENCNFEAPVIKMGLTFCFERFKPNVQHWLKINSESSLSFGLKTLKLSLLNFKRKKSCYTLLKTSRASDRKPFCNMLHYNDWRYSIGISRAFRWCLWANIHFCGLYASECYWKRKSPPCDSIQR